MAFEVSGEKVKIITVTGRLDGTNFEDLIAAAKQANESDVKDFLLDLSECIFMSSAGMMALHSATLIARGQAPLNPEDGWGAFREMSAEQEADAKKLVLVGVADKIQQTLEMAGLIDSFALYDDLDSALASF